jgi:hypothetical protein
MLERQMTKTGEKNDRKLESEELQNIGEEDDRLLAYRMTECSRGE